MSGKLDPLMRDFLDDKGIDERVMELELERDGLLAEIAELRAALEERSFEVRRECVKLSVESREENPVEAARAMADYILGQEPADDDA